MRQLIFPILNFYTPYRNVTLRANGLIRTECVYVGDSNLTHLAFTKPPFLVFFRTGKCMFKANIEKARFVDCDVLKGP